jgi:hypothetical protein
MKDITLKAFKIEKNDLFSSPVELRSALHNKFREDNLSSDRRMRISKNDPNEEEDLICDFKSVAPTRPFFGTLLRIKKGSEVQHIDSELFAKEKFTIRDLDTTKVDGEALYKHHYYFSVGKNHLVTNSTHQITQLQTYLNWLLTEIFELCPMIADDKMPQLKDIESLVFVDPILQLSAREKSKSQGLSSLISDLGIVVLDFLKGSIVDPLSITDAQYANIVSAQLLIKLKKPSEKDGEEIKKALSAVLKPIQELDNLAIKTRSSQKLIKGNEIARCKTVSIETTELKFISEEQLEQEMHKFLLELENEENSI